MMRDGSGDGAAGVRDKGRGLGDVCIRWSWVVVVVVVGVGSGGYGGAAGVRSAGLEIPIKAPGRARGELEITYLDEELRASRGDKGNLFILKMVDPSYRVPVPKE
ncbi:hypothetical protein F0562_029005 [Nyssa sinensis]|uniref:Plastid lipid-associated protein/fibrillin conserved domain-containing protein n=1 Tax=Nyssa sinensis TaxID=561372 RepID=A0A5J5B3Y2_9ASTE|nr:hypothetical protein F0562_029005 [Nyssa sinensis]